jgi:probable rRNA maturation factor
MRKKLAVLLRSAGVPDAELSVLIAGDRAVRSLNLKYRGIDRTTDVLSFSQREGRFANLCPELLGDIVVSAPRAAAQARAAGHSLAREIDALLVHGLLHLLGWDHEKGSRAAEAMRRMEKRLLARIAR